MSEKEKCDRCRNSGLVFETHPSGTKRMFRCYCAEGRAVKSDFYLPPHLRNCLAFEIPVYPQKKKETA